MGCVPTKPTVLAITPDDNVIRTLSNNWCIGPISNGQLTSQLMPARLVTEAKLPKAKLSGRRVRKSAPKKNRNKRSNGMYPIRKFVTTAIGKERKINRALDVYMENDSKNEGPVIAIRTMLESIKQMHAAVTPEQRLFLDRVVVSTNKEFKTENGSIVTTSVSSGMATTHEGESHFLNCGSGATKFQVFKKHDGRALSTVDIKLKFSLSELIVPGVYDGTKTAMDLRHLLCTQVPDFEGTCFVFITGKIRSAYYKATPAQKALFDAEFANVFDNMGIDFKPWFGSTYTMDQEQEATHEFSSIKNLIGFVDKDAELLMSYGIGVGSCQSMVNEKYIKWDYGMGNTEKLSEYANETLFYQSFNFGTL